MKNEFKKQLNEWMEVLENEFYKSKNLSERKWISRVEASINELLENYELMKKLGV